MTNEQIGAQFQTARAGVDQPSPAPLVLPADLMAALRRMDANTANWETVNPDQFKGMSDATGDESGLD